MYHVEDEPMETIHVYVVREKEEKRPYVLLPLLLAAVCLLSIVGVTVYSGKHPYVVQETKRVPAIFLPPSHFRISVPVIPTGRKTYPATKAYGILTITNGSILSEHLPQGMIFTAANGTEVITTEAVDVPGGNGTSYGVSNVSAQAVTSGTNGNIEALTIDQVYGTFLYIRNDQPFTGGKEAYSVPVIQPQDTKEALTKARNILIQHTLDGLLDKPCAESVQGVQTLSVSWTCQFVTYTPVYETVVSTKVQGKCIVLEVEHVARPRMYYGK